jgi:hypothetical protein
MLPECNFDDGDCARGFSMAADSALQQCDRTACPHHVQDGKQSECYSSCFNAACDFSRFRCAPVKAGLRDCPAFDAAALASYAASQVLIFPEPSSMKGGEEAAGAYRGFGRCALNASEPAGCRPAVQGSRAPVFLDAGDAAGSESPRTAVSFLGSAGVAQVCAPGAFACAPALPWAWADGCLLLTRDRDSIAVQLSVRFDAAVAGRRVIVSSETFGIGVAASGPAAAVLSLRTGNSDYADFSTCILRHGEWHRLVVSFKRTGDGSGSWVPIVYVNESEVPLGGWAPQPSALPLSFALSGGLAVGRDFPTPEYLTGVQTKADDGSSYFAGAVAGLRLWATGEAAAAAAAAGAGTTCRDASSMGSNLSELVACYDFNGTLEDSLRQVDLSLRAGDKYRPWCTTLNDDGHFIYNPHPTTGVVEDVGEQWGFCSSTRTLPSSERDYDPAELAGLDRMPTASLLARYPRCGRVPLIFVNNRAVSQHGGAVFDGGYADQLRCFLGVPSGASPAYQIVFANNSAGGAGGAVYLDSPSMPPACRQALNQSVGLPREDKKVLFGGNAADAWGDNVATQPAGIKCASGTYGYVPGIDPLDLTAELTDSFGQLVRGSSSFTNPYLVKAQLCVSGGSCSERSSLGQAAYFGCDKSGQCQTAWGGVQCLVNQSGATVILSHGKLDPVEVAVRCFPCREGQQVQQQAVPGGKGLFTWACTPCGSGMTVVDPNDPLHGCIGCPSGAICPGGASPLVGVDAADVTVWLGSTLSATLAPASLAAALSSALPSVLPLASPHVVLMNSRMCASEGYCLQSRRTAVGQDEMTLTFHVIMTSSRALARGVPQLVDSEGWDGNLTLQLAQLGFDVRVLGVHAAVVETYPAIGQWEAFGGFYRLVSCLAGYLVVNSSLSQQQCVECQAGSYSFDSYDGCRGGVCDWRTCTACPTGAVCASGSSETWSRFVPRVLQSGQGPVPSVTLVLPRKTYTLFYQPSPDRYVWTNESLDQRSASRQYVWQFLHECTVLTSPCDAASAPSFLLRTCPPGHALENSTLGTFRQALQNCVPCLAGQYIINPSVPPCVDCPLGGNCAAGVFRPLVAGSVWETVGQYSRIRGCPPGYILVRSCLPAHPNEWMALTDELLSARQEERPSADSCVQCPVGTYSPSNSTYVQGESAKYLWTMKAETATVLCRVCPGG